MCVCRFQERHQVRAQSGSVSLRSGWNSLGSVFRRTERLLRCVSISVYVFKFLLDPAEEAGVTLGRRDLTGSRGQRDIALRGRERVRS